MISLVSKKSKKCKVTRAVISYTLVRTGVCGAVCRGAMCLRLALQLEALPFGPATIGAAWFV